MPDKKNIPMCWKCKSKITEQKDKNASTLIGCVEENKIHGYKDAETMCPLIFPKNKVIIIVTGGCVTIDYKPDDVEIEIRDYDVEGSWDEDDVSCKVDEDDDRYQEMIFPAENNNTEIEFHASGDQAFPAKGIEVKDIIGQDGQKAGIMLGAKEEPEDENKYLNYYKCTCGVEWQDHWSCMCDDRCPTCNTSIQCYKSVETETDETIEHFDPDKD